MKNKNVLIFGIVLFVVLQFGFVNSQSQVPEIDGEYISISLSSEGDSKIITFNQKGSFVEIEGNRFENIQPTEKSLNPSFIKIDNEGNILELDLTTNENDGNFLINGVPIKVPANSRVVYRENNIYLPKKSKVDKFEVRSPIKIQGQEINLFDEISLNGESSITNEGVLIEKGEANYKQLKIKTDKNSGNLLIANPKTDLSNYKGNWIKQTSNSLEIKSFEKGSLSIEFLENNEILNIAKYGKLKALVSDGDGLIFEKGDVTHKSSETGKTLISNGDKTIALNKNGIYATKEKEGAGYIEMKIHSDSKEVNSVLKINNRGELLTGEKLVPSMVGDRLVWKTEEYTPEPRVNYLGTGKGEIISITPLQEDEFYKFIPPGVNRPQVYTIEDLPASAKIVSYLTPNVQKELDILNELDYQYNRREEGRMNPEEVELKERIASTIIPAGYAVYFGKVERIFEGEEKGIQEFTSTLPGKVRTDLFRTYLGLPQQFETVKFTGREIVPTQEKNPTTQYYGFDAKQIIKQRKDVYDESLTFNELENYVKENQKIPQNSYTAQLLKYKAHIGFDEKKNERYISYYDLWDLDPPILKDVGIDIDKYNFPIEVYGRIYESDFKEVEQK